MHLLKVNFVKAFHRHATCHGQRKLSGAVRLKLYALHPPRLSLCPCASPRWLLLRFVFWLIPLCPCPQRRDTALPALLKLTNHCLPGLGVPGSLTGALRGGHFSAALPHPARSAARAQLAPPSAHRLALGVPPAQGLTGTPEASAGPRRCPSEETRGLPAPLSWPQRAQSQPRPSGVRQADSAFIQGRFVTPPPPRRKAKSYRLKGCLQLPGARPRTPRTPSSAGLHASDHEAVTSCCGTKF